MLWIGEALANVSEVGQIFLQFPIIKQQRGSREGASGRPESEAVREMDIRRLPLVCP